MKKFWRCACLQVLVSFLLIHQNQAKEKERFVERVDCIADGFTVILNKSDPAVMKMISNPKSQPVVYVYGYKTRHSCGTSMKDEKGLPHYNLTVPFGSDCDVTLTDLPFQSYAETTVVLEDSADFSFGKTTRLNHVFCTYTKRAKTTQFSDVSNGHDMIASTGGKPKPKVELLFRNTGSGSILKVARESEYVEFFIALSPDSTYHGISPKECAFSDREDISDPDARKITFVQGGCPMNGMEEIIDTLANVNNQIYFSKFRAFRFGNQSTVYVHCQVQVCLKKEECSKACYKKGSDSNLTAKLVPFRHKRSINDLTKRTTRSIPTDDNVFDITSSFTVVSNTESVEFTSIPVSEPVSTIANEQSEQSGESCPSTSSFGFVPLLIMGALASFTVFSTGAAICFGCKLRNIKKKYSFDMMSAISNPAASL